MGSNCWIVRLALGIAGLGLALPIRAQESVETTWLANIRQVTSGFEKAGEGYFSPDGGQIVYQAISADYPFYQIYTQPLNGGPPRRVSSGRGRTTCAYFSPDGQRLLFASGHLDPQLDQTEAAGRKQQEEDRQAGRRRRYQWDFDPWMDMFETRLDGTLVRRLTDAAGYDAEGAWSADGTKIAFCSDRDGDPDIYIMDADGSHLRQLTNVAGYDGGPFISPNGKWVVFRSDRVESQLLQIHVIGVDGRHDTPLTATKGVNWGPFWHPTQPYLIWSGADHTDPNARPNYDLWLARYEEQGGSFRLVGDVRRVTDSPSADVLPVFSPDGARLMWTSTRADDHSSQLFLADFRLPDAAAAARK